MKTPIFKRVIKIFLKIFLVVLIIVLFSGVGLGIYYLGVAKGYQIATKDAESQVGIIASILDQIKNEKIPSPTSSPKTITSLPKQQLLSWGGPDLWNAVNKRRIELGVNPLNQRDELCTVASIRLNELLELGKLDGHEGFSNMRERRPDLAWIFDKYATIAEFLAVGGKTPEETVALWENTLGHKKLLTGGEYVWGCIYAQETFAVAIVAF